MGASAHDRGAGEGVEEGKRRERVTEKSQGRGRVEAEGQTRGRVKDEDQGRGRVEDEGQERLRATKKAPSEASNSSNDEPDWGSQADAGSGDGSDDPRSDAEKPSMGLASEAKQRTPSEAARAHDSGAKSSTKGDLITWAAFVGRGPDSKGNWTCPVCKVQKDGEQKLQCHVWSLAGDRGHPPIVTQKTWFPNSHRSRAGRRQRRH